KLAVENMHLESDSVSGDGMVDADGGCLSLGSKLKSLSPDGFFKLLEEVFMILQGFPWEIKKRTLHVRTLHVPLLHPVLANNITIRKIMYLQLPRD
ncbi:Vacuolar sorting-associated 54 chloroplastic, partial [Olea europaea subsp. europaea]